VHRDIDFASRNPISVKKLSRVPMHRIFQNFIDRLSSTSEPDALRDALAEAVAALDLSCFAYLSVPRPSGAAPQLISTYPSAWTTHYLQNHYERFDPVILQALGRPEPFEWGLAVGPTTPSASQRELFEEAARFGIRSGFTIPIHDSHGPIAAVTFAADERQPQFERCIREHGRVLQLMSMYFHAHARCKLVPDRVVDGVSLSPREFECLDWTSQGKSAWEIGRILGISRRTAAFHLDNAKAKLGVHSNYQAVARLVASRPMMQ
jgi:LuxR family transcriptional regulator, activator of conjugal transfer of Ti plasmids